MAEREGKSGGADWKGSRETGSLLPWGIIPWRVSICCLRNQQPLNRIIDKSVKIVELSVDENKISGNLVENLSKGSNMLLEYGAKNFFCFKEWISISFRLGAGCPQYISQEKQVSNVVCIKGANGSGKTNALKILAFLREFTVNSFNYKPEATIKTDSFFGNNENTEFYIEFEQSESTYKYELLLNKGHVVSEILFKKQKRYSKVLERNSEKIIMRTNEFKDIDIIKLRKNASIISTAHQYEVKSFAPIYDFFKCILTNLTYFGLSERSYDVGVVSKLYHGDPKIFDFVKTIIKKCDIGISDIQIQTRREEDGAEVFFPIFCYEIEKNEKCLTFYTQSSGTKSLYLQLGIYKVVLDIGGVLVLDEFDINLHPHILPVLLNVFMDASINKNNAQLVFSTHNSEILDYLGKYRTVLVNKEENQCYGYRLDEIPGDIIRNDRPLAPIYNTGKVGGVPRV